MSHIETNIYLIENLEELNCRYRTYRIFGIPESDDYHKNMNLLVDILSRKTKSPCALFNNGQETLIAQPEGYQDLPKSIEVIRAVAKLEKLSEVHELAFDQVNSATAKLASRFLQFALQNPLYNNPLLWQPAAGYPYYSKYPDPDFSNLSKNIDLYRGFTFSVVALQEGRMGICVDTRSKYVDRFPLPTRISLKEFKEKYKGSNCLYEYPNSWYEITLDGYNNLNVSQMEYPKGVSLFDHLHKLAGPQKTQNLRNLPRDCSLLVYYTSLREPRNAPSGLCKLTYSTYHPEVKPFHSQTIKSPFDRREEIQVIIDRYFRSLPFGSADVVLSDRPLLAEANFIKVPDLEFGNGKILSVRGSQNSIETSLEDLPFRKREQLYSRNAGLYLKKPFDCQYLIMPESVYDSFGEKFLEAVKEEAQRLCPREEGIIYNPIIIPYNVTVQKNMYNLAKEIMNAVQENRAENGFGIVMIPRLRNKPREEDQLANYLMRQLRKRELFVSIIHTEVPENCYEYTRLEDGKEGWRLVPDSRKMSTFRGYIRNVVLNKILITNNIWPFVLKTPLNADLTIGIDVKNNTAGFTIIYKSGGEVRFIPSESGQREQLSKDHVASKVYQIIKEEKELLSKDIRKIVIHRQGTLFPTEKIGISQALKRLEKEKLITQGYECTFAEIRTTSRIPFRLFNISIPSGRQREKVSNPTIGFYYPFSENDAFICTTGYPYKFWGTSHPLHIIKEGEMSPNQISEDGFYLSNLTWTNIEQCSRLPLSIKMNDIRLREIAGEYDPDAFEFAEEEE